jgi:hypothetical protein
MLCQPSRFVETLYPFRLVGSPIGRRGNSFDARLSAGRFSPRGPLGTSKCLGEDCILLLDGAALHFPATFLQVGDKPIYSVVDFSSSETVHGQSLDGRNDSRPMNAVFDFKLAWHRITSLLCAKHTRSEQLACFASLCIELGQTPSAIALAWTLHQEGIAATIIGPSSREQLVSIAHVPEIQLSAAMLDRIDAIFPPCGPAPEAYAW